MLNVSATSSSSQTTPASTQSTGASTVSQGTTAETEQPTTSADSKDLEGTYHFKAKPNIRKFSCMSFLTTERDLSLGRPLCERPSIQSVFRRTPKPSWIVQTDRSFRLAFTQYCRSDCVMAHFSFYWEAKLERPSIQSVFRRTPKPSWIVQADRSFRLAFTQYCRSDCVMAHFSFYWRIYLSVVSHSIYWPHKTW